MRESEKSEVRSQKSGDAGKSAGISVDNQRLSALEKGGNKTMSKLAKKVAGLLVGVGMLVSGLVFVEKAEALQFSTNNVTQLLILFTPRVDRGVFISSDNVGDFGSLELAIDTYTVRPATISIIGNISPTELNIGATMQATVAGERSWNFAAVTDPLAGSEDTPGVWGVFSGVARSSVPTNAEFQVSNATIAPAMATSNERAGGASGPGTRFEYVGDTPATNDMDLLSVGNQRHYWLRMRTPNTTTVGGEQRLIVTFNVVSSGF